MIIIDYKKKYHNKIVKAAVAALELGKCVVYPTDTSYGIAVDATNFDAIIRLYRIKERDINKPIHIIAPSLAKAKKIGQWNKQATQLAQKFWPGPLTLVLKIKDKQQTYKLLGAKTGNIGLRMPKNTLALDLAKILGRPITTTSANPSAAASGGHDSYSAKEVLTQFRNKKHQPDIVINAGKLAKRKPSTVVKIDNHELTILRIGPITKKQIQNATNS